jgi:tRNA-specific 2-thiouridylase
MLSQEELAHCLFPVGSMPKSETRSIATELGLRTADKPDSQEICFVRSGDVGAYVSENIPEASVPGPLLDTAGNLLGEHRGIGNYTIGQRKGLGIALGAPVFVTHIDAVSNSVVVGDRTELMTGGFTLDEVSFVHEAPAHSAPVLVQHRAHGDVNPATVLWWDDRPEVVYDEPVGAIAPGQSAALYSVDEPDLLLGGGIIAARREAGISVS